MNYRGIYILLLIVIPSILSAFSLSGNTNIDSLVNEADAVVLKDERIMEIKSNNSAYYKVFKSILIKNKKALKYCSVLLIENDFQSIEDMDGVIKDTSGNVIKELESDDIMEAEISPGFIFYSGNLYKGFELKHHEFPFIFELSYELEFNTLFVWPDYHPQSDIPCLSSTYNLKVNGDIEFTYAIKGDIGEPVVSNINGAKEYKWELKDIPPQIDEDYMPPENKIQMAVKFVPKEFEVDGHKGSFGSWAEFAKWYKSLADGHYSLPDDAKAEITALVSGVENPKEKIRILYNYLQNNTRYVALEMGIGSWQPHTAESVHKNLYGDCKDLSTYMVAMLDAVGIKAYPALARTKDRGKLDPDFVTNGFNHCITMVPLEEDTLWLECTSSYTDMDDVPYGIEDISALIVDENGGRLVTTPQKSSKENFSRLLIKGAINPKGQLVFDAELNLGGNQKNFYKRKFEIKNDEEDQLFIKNIFNRYSPKFFLTEYSLKNNEGKDYTISLKGLYGRFVNLRRKRIFINPALLHRETEEDLPDEEIDERKFPVFYNYPYLDVDSVEIRIPKFYKIESIPKDFELTTSFGQYESKFKIVGDKVIYKRSMEILKNRIPLDHYAEYYNFIKKIIKRDKSKIVLKRK